MEAAIITIGDELLIGQVVNTNAAWLGDELTGIGVSVIKMVTTADDRDAIRTELHEALQATQLVIITGGLGPTHDDITKRVVADYFEMSYRFDEKIFEEIKRRFDARRIHVAASNEGQAMIPEGFEILHNPIGTAPGLWYAFDDEQGKHLLCMLPGVPQEMKVIMQREVLPRLVETGRVGRIVRRTLLTTGIGESNLNELVGDISDQLDDNLKLAFLPGLKGVRMRLTGFPDRDAAVQDRMVMIEAVLREKAGSYFFGVEDDTIEGIVGAMLKERGLSIATAESCTGGLVSSRLTDVAGSSEYVLGGLVAYDNAVKVMELRVDPKTIDSFGTVSRQVATQMAAGIRTRMNADIGVSTTGIMGPGGGTDDKPVGSVWIGYASETGSSAALLRLAGDRLQNKDRTATAVLNMVRLRLEKRDRRQNL